MDESFVWMGSLGKVYVFDMKEGIWKNCPIKEGLSFWINDILVQKDYVWLATDGAGLIRYSKYDNSWKAFTSQKNNLTSNTLKNICGQMDRMWISTATLFGGEIMEVKLDSVISNRAYE